VVGVGTVVVVVAGTLVISTLAAGLADDVLFSVNQEGVFRSSAMMIDCLAMPARVLVGGATGGCFDGPLDAVKVGEATARGSRLGEGEGSWFDLCHACESTRVQLEGAPDRNQCEGIFNVGTVVLACCILSWRLTKRLIYRI
jgi:hypothetical protein